MDSHELTCGVSLHARAARRRDKVRRFWASVRARAKPDIISKGGQRPVGGLLACRSAMI
jgi:hypothetical protein